MNNLKERKEVIEYSVKLNTTNLSPLQFDVTGSDVAYLEADVTFRYRSFTVVNV